MSERFLKFIPSEEALWLLKKKGHAFRLLTIIAESARRYEGDPDGLKVGECFIGGHKNYDMTERNYRTAKEILVMRRHLEIVETCRTRQKSTTGSTTVGTKVKLLSTNVWDINPEPCDDRSDDRPTTDRRPTDDKLRKRRRNKNLKKDHPSVPSVRSDPMTDDLSFEKEKTEISPGVFLSQEDLEACLKIKGDRESVRVAIEFIQSSKKRKHPIANWPNALAKWKIENKSLINVEENIAIAQVLCEKFVNFEDGSGWKCSMYHDRKKDQKGILFEAQSPYEKTAFVAFIDGEFDMKCNEIVQNRMRKK